MTIEQFEKKKTNKDGSINEMYNGFQLITDSQDVQPVLEYIGKTRTAKKHGIEGLFVKIKNGDYIAVYGFKGNIPYLYKSLVKLY
jgi:hypothetical protein